MVPVLGRFGWHGYVIVSVAVPAVGLAGVLGGTPRGRRCGAGAATALPTLTPVLGAIPVFVVANGMRHGDGRPWHAAVAALAGVAAVTALLVARARLRRAG
ncbi:hypothetical protein [Saccharothrix luteola]|uniref:hypothetical protein n=1 Tax=Saccharothrix luteola TaxID=2893018 RepID=UPI001E303C80|nr:hypothetical protein [Saccharothrix luteola]MCC8246149.1 hypothetical protein [Saccharothrix luteola]